MYTIAGVAVVVTGAGVYYYSTSSKPGSSGHLADETKRASKKERRKAKKEKEKGEAATRETPSQTGEFLRNFFLGRLYSSKVRHNSESAVSRI